MRSLEQAAEPAGSEPEKARDQQTLPPLPPDAMIIVPVRNFVLFPGMVMPITRRPAALDRGRAAGRARAAPDRHPACSATPRSAEPAPIDMHRIGTVANVVRYVTAPDGSHHLVCQGEQRFQVVEFLERLAVLRRARAAHPGADDPHARDRGALRCICAARRWRRSSCCRRRRRSWSPPIQAIESPGALADLDRGLHGHQAGGEAGDPRDDRRRRAHGQGARGCWRSASRCCGCRAEIGQQTKASLDERQREVLLREQMAAIQKQLGEGEEGKAAEIAELDKAIAKAGMPKEVEEQARKELRRLQRMPEGAAEYGMVRTYLDWLIELPWKLPEESADRHRRGAPHPRRGPLRPRQDQAAHHRISRRAQARAARQGADPVLRRPARRRQDLARPVDRARHEPQVRARQPRRRARRGRDPRPSAHLYRRAAGQHHPGDPQGRHAQLRDDARRDRQARRRHPRRSVGGAARGARSGAEQHVPRQLSRRAVRSEPRGVHHHRQHARHHPGAAARPHGDHQPRRLHRRREAADRHALSGAAPAGGERPQGRPGRDRPTTRCARSSSTTRARPACAISSARSARRCAMPRCASPKARTATIRIDRDDLATILGAPQFENEVAMRTSVPGVATGLAWTPVGGDILFIEATRIPGQRQADPHRPARRRDEGERAGGAQPRQEPRRRARHRPGRASRRATSTSTCRRARSRRTGRARASPCSWR